MNNKLILLVTFIHIALSSPSFAAPIHTAARIGSPFLIQTLIQKFHANINEPDNNGWTPLHIAARYGHVKTVQTLISAGASVNSTDHYRWTPLHHAASLFWDPISKNRRSYFYDQTYTEIAKILIVAGADLDARAWGDRTPFFFARSPHLSQFRAHFRGSDSHQATFQPEIVGPWLNRIADDEVRAGRGLEAARIYTFAARAFHLAHEVILSKRNHAFAADCYSRLGDHHRAATSYTAAGDHGNAAVHYTKIGNPAIAAEHYAAAGNHAAAAVNYTRAGNLAAAAINYAAAGGHLAVATHFIESAHAQILARNYSDAAESYTSASLSYDALLNSYQSTAARPDATLDEMKTLLQTMDQNEAQITQVFESELVFLDNSLTESTEAGLEFAAESNLRALARQLQDALDQIPGEVQASKIAVQDRVTAIEPETVH